MARDCNSAGLPSQRHGSAKRVNALDRIGSCSWAVCQLTPPSHETSTCLTLPLPLQASPRISYRPGAATGFSGQGKVMTDLASLTQVKPRALPSGISSVYFEVSSRENHGASPTLMRRSHLTLTLPSQPGTRMRSG